VDWAAYAKPVALDELTYGIEWNRSVLGQSAPQDGMWTLPEFYRYRLVKTDSGKQVWKAVDVFEVPRETGLRQAQFPKPQRITEPYITPTEADSTWKKPGPVAGPFTRTLGDGSEITYSWYRFADQPALMNADLTPAEREQLQRRVVLAAPGGAFAPQLESVTELLARAHGRQAGQH